MCSIDQKTSWEFFIRECLQIMPTQYFVPLWAKLQIWMLVAIAIFAFANILRLWYLGSCEGVDQLCLGWIRGPVSTDGPFRVKRYLKDYRFVVGLVAILMSFVFLLLYCLVFRSPFQLIEVLVDEGQLWLLAPASLPYIVHYVEIFAFASILWSVASFLSFVLLLMNPYGYLVYRLKPTDKDVKVVFFSPSRQNERYEERELSKNDKLRLTSSFLRFLIMDSNLVVEVHSTKPSDRLNSILLTITTDNDSDDTLWHRFIPRSTLKVKEVGEWNSTSSMVEYTVPDPTTTERTEQAERDKEFMVICGGIRSKFKLV